MSFNNYQFIYIYLDKIQKTKKKSYLDFILRNFSVHRMGLRLVVL